MKHPFGLLVLALQLAAGAPDGHLHVPLHPLHDNVACPNGTFRGYHQITWCDMLTLLAGLVAHADCTSGALPQRQSLDDALLAPQRLRGLRVVSPASSLASCLSAITGMTFVAPSAGTFQTAWRVSAQHGGQ